jgi:hypothetical protein
MSYLSSTYIQCEVIQEMLDNAFATCLTPEESMPFLTAVLQTQSANGISQSVATGDGKVKTVKVIYDQRLLESETTSGSGARTCTTNDETFDHYTTYTIDSTAWIKAEESFDTADLATVCTNDVQSMIANKIKKIADVLERAVATQTATQGVALYGEWGSAVTLDNGSDELVVSTFIGSAANKVLDYTAMTEIDLALKQTGYCAPAIIVGGSTLYKYGKNIEAGCCSDTGVDLLAKANQFGKAFMYDKRIATALASENKSLVFQAGSLALITYNESTQVPNLGANYAKFKIFSPRTGLPIDIVMSDDCGHISVIGYVNTKLVGLPTDMYKAGDEYAGVTLVNKILVTNS